MVAARPSQEAQQTAPEATTAARQAGTPSECSLAACTLPTWPCGPAHARNFAFVQSLRTGAGPLRVHTFAAPAQSLASIIRISVGNPCSNPTGPRLYAMSISASFASSGKPS